MVYVKIIQDAVDIIDTCKPVPINFLLPPNDGRLAEPLQTSRQIKPFYCPCK